MKELTNTGVEEIVSGCPDLRSIVIGEFRNTEKLFGINWGRPTRPVGGATFAGAYDRIQF
jgi:hypothetical protein